MTSPGGAPHRPRVKVCGVTRPDEALLAAELGADLLGLNFHPPSPRWIEPAAAARLARAVRAAHGDAVRLVGVFVNLPRAEVEAIDAEVRLDLLQFHGDEKAADLAGFEARAIKAFRVADRLDPAVVRDFEDVWGYLFDYRHPRLYGGSGKSWDFSSLETLPDPRKPTLIAGGLGPDNLRAALAVSAPWGVDVCSGVESTPGRKDPALLRRLFEEIHHHGQGTTPS